MGLGFNRLWAAAAVIATAAAAAAPIEVSQRIVGGSVVNPAFKYPFLVGITSPGYYCCTCGGTLIGAVWVLTAAHCITAGDEYQVLVYGHSRTMEAGLNHECTEEIAVVETHCHESYNADTEAADVCLLKLARAPRCASKMAGGNEYAVLDTTGTGHAATGASVIVAGWGTMSQGGESPDVMHDVTISMLDYSDCNSAYEGSVLQGMVCAGVWEGGKDSCQGDSGGPLFVQQSGTWYVVGIVSWGSGCAQANFPGIYTSVAYYNSWILATMVSAPGAPPPPPAPPSVPGQCTNECQYYSDGECDDGGSGAEYDDCDLGSDCLDCGVRDVDFSPPSPSAPESAICLNSCSDAADGFCDDGGQGADYSICEAGTDCLDCGFRETVASPPPRSPPSAPPSPSPSPSPRAPPSSPPGVGCVAGSSISRCLNSCAASCSSCACQTCAVCATVTVAVVASGSVNDYEDTTDLQNRFAVAANVPPGAVVVSVSAASVRIVATISPVSGTTASSVKTRMRTYVGTAADASVTLGVAVATDPTITKESSGLALGVLIGIIVGAVVAFIFVVGLLVMFICCCMGRAGLRGGGSKSGIQPEPDDA